MINPENDYKFLTKCEQFMKDIITIDPLYFHGLPIPHLDCVPFLIERFNSTEIYTPLVVKILEVCDKYDFDFHRGHLFGSPTSITELIISEKGKFNFIKINSDRVYYLSNRFHEDGPMQISKDPSQIFFDTGLDTLTTVELIEYLDLKGFPTNYWEWNDDQITLINMVI